MKNTGTPRRTIIAAAGLAGLFALTQPFPAQAEHGGGGGFHGGGGGFHGGFSGGGFRSGGFGGFHGGFSGGGFRSGFGGSRSNGFFGGGFRRDGFGGFHRGFDRFRGGGFFGAGLAAGPYFYGWGGDPFYGYGDSERFASSQYWYYCQDPAGYYPYVSQCGTAWQPVPAG